MSIEREIDFLHRLANECEGHGQEFGNGRAVGIREAVKPLHTEITRLTRELAEARSQRDGLAKAITADCRCKGTGQYEGSCRMCGDSTFDHVCEYPTYQCKKASCVAARAALDAAKGGA